jgi:hypothetical protein
VRRRPAKLCPCHPWPAQPWPHLLLCALPGPTRGSPAHSRPSLPRTTALVCPCPALPLHGQPRTSHSWPLFVLCTLPGLASQARGSPAHAMRYRCAVRHLLARLRGACRYFDEKGLVRQQLDSFNDFIETTIQEIVMDSLPVELVSGNQHLTNEVEDTPTTRIKFGKVRRRKRRKPPVRVACPSTRSSECSSKHGAVYALRLQAGMRP